MARSTGSGYVVEVFWGGCTWRSSVYEYLHEATAEAAWLPTSEGAPCILYVSPGESDQIVCYFINNKIYFPDDVE